MRILIAPDSFKGSLTSIEAALAMAKGIRSVIPDADMISMPLADGGEGTLAVVQAAHGGDVRDDVLYVEDDGCCYALIESARCVGLTLPSMQGDVFERGSAALGKAVCEVLNAGGQDIRIALGGSATVDGGLGLLLALGCRVLDVDDVSVSADLNGLMRARRIDIAGLDQRLGNVRMTILSDVQNPLCGNDGAVHVYGAQKGIAPARLSAVDAAMQHWAVVCEQTFENNPAASVAAGAAGGLGFALQLLGAQVVSGAEYMMQVSGFDRIVSTVDWVVTGEGRSDAQTLHGKLPWMVAQQACQAGVPVALISGDIMGEQALADSFDCMISAKPAHLSVVESMQQAEHCLAQAAARWAAYVLKNEAA